MPIHLSSNSKGTQSWLSEDAAGKSIEEDVILQVLQPQTMLRFTVHNQHFQPSLEANQKAIEHILNLHNLRLQAIQTRQCQAKERKCSPWHLHLVGEVGARDKNHSGYSHRSQSKVAVQPFLGEVFMDCINSWFSLQIPDFLREKERGVSLSAIQYLSI